MSNHPLEKQLSDFIESIIKPKDPNNGLGTSSSSQDAFENSSNVNCGIYRNKVDTFNDYSFKYKYYLHGKNSFFPDSVFSSEVVPESKELVEPNFKSIIRIGSLSILNIGDALLFDGNKTIFPIGFTSVRIFWNKKHFSAPSACYSYLDYLITDKTQGFHGYINNPRRSAYLCSVRVKDRLPYFSIDMISNPKTGNASKRLASGVSINSVFRSFLDIIGCNKPCGLDAISFFGLNLHVVLQQLRLDFATTFMRRISQFSKSSSFKGSILGNNVHRQMHIKRKIRLGEYRNELPFKIRRNSLDDLVTTMLDFKDSEPCVMDNSDNRCNRIRSIRQYMNNSAMQYRYLLSLPPERRLDVKTSAIHGLGLFTTEDIPSGEPVVEYVGELIRDIISDKREELYSKGQGGDGSCYMFRLDEQLIVDATRKGNMSRFINHSCDPNCLCRIITCENGLKHIVVFSKCDLKAGDEVTYDYQFGIESETRKIQCLCGAPNCLGRMN